MYTIVMDGRHWCVGCRDYHELKRSEEHNEWIKDKTAAGSGTSEWKRMNWKDGTQWRESPTLEKLWNT